MVKKTGKHILILFLIIAVTFSSEAEAFYAMAGVAGMGQEGNVPGTERDGDAAGTGQGGETPGAGLDGDTAGTSQDGETPEAGLGGDVPGTDPGEEAPVDTAYTVTFDLAGGFASDGAAEVQLQVDAGALLEEGAVAEPIRTGYLFQGVPQTTR